MLATNDVEALMPKIPLQQQSINLPGADNGGVEDSLQAVAARNDLRKAMRKERKAKIKEANFLKAV
jgi:large subunit ribosomal protein L54